jgi:hypothetical protein
VLKAKCYGAESGCALDEHFPRFASTFITAGLKAIITIVGLKEDKDFLMRDQY